ncbi:MAG: hypothetical protein AB7T06_01855 [Kofleriaceae bacterium]
MQLLRKHGHLAILLAAGLLLVVYACPGYMNYDAAEQLIQARADWKSDGHPPIIVAYWQLFELIVDGPFTLLILQVALFLYGAYTLLRLRFSRKAATWLTTGILLFPPMFTTLAVVWKDSQMASFLLAGVALALRPHRGARTIGVFLLIIAAAVRYNAGAALPTLVFLALTLAWRIRRVWLRIVIAFVFLAATYFATSSINWALANRHDHLWYRTTAVFDIVGIGCHSSVTSDEEFLTLLDGTALIQRKDLKHHFCRLFPPGTRDWFLHAELFKWEVVRTERLARKAAWKRMVLEYPGAWLKTRLLLAKDHLGLWEGVPLWEPVCQTFTGTYDQRQRLHIESELSSLQQAMGDGFRWIATHTPLYRPWIYLVASLLLFGWAIWRRDLLVASIVGSGLSYELSILLVANSPDVRYAHWMITCTLFGLVFRYAKRTRLSEGSHD